jgi:hypothetical protein
VIPHCSLDRRCSLHYHSTQAKGLGRRTPVGYGASTQHGASADTTVAADVKLIVAAKDILTEAGLPSYAALVACGSFYMRATTATTIKSQQHTTTIELAQVYKGGTHHPGS